MKLIQTSLSLAILSLLGFNQYQLLTIAEHLKFNGSEFTSQAESSLQESQGPTFDESRLQHLITQALTESLEAQEGRFSVQQHNDVAQGAVTTPQANQDHSASQNLVNQAVAQGELSTVKLQQALADIGELPGDQHAHAMQLLTQAINSQQVQVHPSIN